MDKQMPSFATWLQEHQRLSMQEKAAYRDLHSTLQQAKPSTVSQSLHELRQADIMAIAERITETRRVTTNMKALKVSVREAARACKDKILSLESLRDLLGRTEASLSSARYGWNSASDILRVREAELQADIGVSLQRYQTLATLALADANIDVGPETAKPIRYSDLPLSSAHKKPRQTSARPFARDARPYSLRIIEDEMERLGGPTGGWDARDHDRFFAKWLASRNIFDRKLFTNGIYPLFPTRTLAALVLHDQFCQRYQELVEKRKGIIAAWRQNTEDERQQAVEQATGASARDSAGAAADAKGRREGPAREHAAVLAWRERKGMAFEDARSLGVMARLHRVRETQLARHRLRAREDAKRVAKEREAPAQPQEADTAAVPRDMLQYREEHKQRVERRKALLARKEAEIEAARERSRALIERKRQEVDRDTHFVELARRAAPLSVRTVKRDMGRLLKPTVACEQSSRELEEIRKQKAAGGKDGGGGRRLTDVTVGFDPYAVVPIAGGRSHAAWMQ